MPNLNTHHLPRVPSRSEKVGVPGVPGKRRLLPDRLAFLSVKEMTKYISGFSKGFLEFLGFLVVFSVFILTFLSLVIFVAGFLSVFHLIFLD